MNNTENKGTDARKLTPLESFAFRLVLNANRAKKNLPAIPSRDGDPIGEEHVAECLAYLNSRGLVIQNEQSTSEHSVAAH